MVLFLIGIFLFKTLVIGKDAIDGITIKTTKNIDNASKSLNGFNSEISLPFFKIVRIEIIIVKTKIVRKINNNFFNLFINKHLNLV